MPQLSSRLASKLEQFLIICPINCPHSPFAHYDSQVWQQGLTVQLVYGIYHGEQHVTQICIHPLHIGSPNQSTQLPPKLKNHL